MGIIIPSSLRKAADMFRLLILLCFSAATFGDLPKGWSACSRSNPKYSDCMSREIENAVRTLANGDKSLGVLPLDPLMINKLEISKGGGAVSMNLFMSNVQLYGLKDIQVKYTINDWKKSNIEVLIPTLHVNFHYKGVGKILVLPLSGEGNGSLTFQKLSVDADIIWKKVKKGDTEYFNMVSLSVPLDPQKMYINLEHLFFSNDAYGDFVNVFLNNNWKIILGEMEEPISKALSMIFTQIANQILSKIPANEIDIA